MSKQTKLDDDALLYQPRKEQTEREKLKEMSFRKKIEYLSEYYKFHALVAVAVITLVSYILYTILNPQSTSQFYAAIIDSPMVKEELDEYSEEFGSLLKIDTTKHTIDLDENYRFSIQDSYSMQLREALVTRVAARQIDVIIAPESEFANYAYAECFLKLSEVLPTNVYSTMTDRFYMGHTEFDTEQKAYGIYLDDTDFVKNASKDAEPYIIGIVANSRHVDNSIEFINYIFDK